MQFKKTITIRASTTDVWRVLTIPELMKQWIGEPEMNIEILCEWKVNSPILITGFQHVHFENKGMIMELIPERLLKYSHLSSISRLPDIIENHAILEFELQPVEDQTSLKLTISNCKTETIFKHLEFYWATTLQVIKEFVEE